MSGYRIVVTVFKEGSTPYTLEFEHFPVTIGSLVENDVVLDHAAVSRKHALVTLSHGKVLFVDQSSNGSYLRQERVSRQVLEDADVISIFPFRLRFALDVAALPEHTDLMQRAALSAEYETGVLTGDQVGPAPQIQPVLRVMASLEHVGSEVHELARKPVIIGRADEVDLVIQDPTVSRAHARVTWREDGTFWLEDLDSSNGTYLNGRPIRAEPIQPGDRIQLGTQVMIELCLAAAAPPAADDLAAASAPPLPTSLVAGLAGVADASSSVVSMPTLTLSSRRAASAPKVLVFEAVGRLDGYTYTKLTEALDRAIDRGERYLVLELSAVEFVDHAGLGALVKAMTTLDGLAGQFRLVGLSQRLRETFTLSRLDSVFRDRVCATEEEALADLSRRPPGRGRRSAKSD